MSYTRKPKRNCQVVFEEPHPLAGLSLTTRPLSVGDFALFGLKLGQASEIEQTGTDAQKLTSMSKLVQAVTEVREMFADALISWDMREEDGTPTPATLEGVNSLSDEEFYGLVGEWLTAVGGLGGGDGELGKGSGSGGTSPELSALMEPLSASQVS